MAALVQICSPHWILQSSGVATISLTGTTTGNSILVAVAQHQAVVGRTYSVSDSLNGSYGSAVVALSANSRYAGIFAVHNIVGSSVTISVTQAGGSVANFYAQAMEVSGVNATDVTDSRDDGAGTTTHDASVTGVTTAANVFAMVVSAVGGNTGTTTESSGWTETSQVIQQHYSMYQGSAGGLVADLGRWTSGSAQRSVNVIASFKATSAGSGAPKSNGLLLRSCG